jgi:hypothetical protein
MLCVFVHFDSIFHVFHLYLPTYDKSPKVVESVSLETLALSLVFILVDFWRFKVGVKDRQH